MHSTLELCPPLAMLINTFLTLRLKRKLYRKNYNKYMFNIKIKKKIISQETMDCFIPTLCYLEANGGDYKILSC